MFQICAAHVKKMYTANGMTKNKKTDGNLIRLYVSL